jgi:hypothetical protein
MRWVKIIFDTNVDKLYQFSNIIPTETAQTVEDSPTELEERLKSS